MMINTGNSKWYANLERYQGWDDETLSPAIIMRGGDTPDAPWASRTPAMQILGGWDVGGI